MFFIFVAVTGKPTGPIGPPGSKGSLERFYHLPLHLSLMGRRFDGKQGDHPVTESVSDRLLRLTFFNDLTSAWQELRERAGTFKAGACLLPL